MSGYTLPPEPEQAVVALAAYWRVHPEETLGKILFAASRRFSAWEHDQPEWRAWIDSDDWEKPAPFGGQDKIARGVVMLAQDEGLINE